MVFDLFFVFHQMNNSRETNWVVSVQEKNVTKLFREYVFISFYFQVILHSRDPYGCQLASLDGIQHCFFTHPKDESNSRPGSYCTMTSSHEDKSYIHAVYTLPNLKKWKVKK